jgi:hypothetical protein
MDDDLIQAGFARGIINPPKGILTIGYGDRFKGNRGVHDDLTATVMVLKKGNVRVGVVALDLLAVHEDLSRAVEAACGLPLLLCCAHTHSAPMTTTVSPLAWRVHRYRAALIKTICQTVEEASTRCQPAEFYWGEGQVDIAVNRRERQPDGRVAIGVHSAGPVDRRAAVLAVRTLQGEVLGRLVNMQCHGTVLGPKNLQVSADWIGAMRGRVEERFGGLTLYIQGATGDLNPKINVGNDFDNVARIGEEAAGTITEILSNSMIRLPATELQLRRKDLWIPLQAAAQTDQPPRTYREVAKTIGLPSFLADPVLDFLYPWRTRLEVKEGRWAFPLQLNLLDLGGFKLGAMGMEVFTEIGMQVRDQFDSSGKMFASLVNSCYGYLPTQEEYQLGGYETTSWQIYRMPGPLPPDADRLAVEGLMALSDQALR